MARSDDLARARYVQTTTLIRQVVERVLALWRDLGPSDVLWEMQGAPGRRIVNLVIAGQLTVAQGAEAFVRASMAARGAASAPLLGSVAATGFAGITGNAQRLDTLLYLPAVRVAQARAAGATDEEAMQAGMVQMARLTGTVLADTSRSATRVAMAADPNVKYYTRVVNLPACARCIILAGQTYSYSEGFKRHERCDCEIRPLDRADWEAVRTPRQLYEAMDPRERRRVFGVAGSQAIDQGADIGQIVNARRGMSDAGDATTTEGTTVRGYYGRQMLRAGGAVDRGQRRYSVVTTPRLSPDEVFRRTDDREAQVALLRANAYLT